MEITQRKTADLIPYVNNARTHSEQQVLQIAASIKEFGFTNPILTDGTNGIIAGHGRLMAAKKIGMEEVPTIELSHLSDAQKKAYVIADNKIALNSDWDIEMLNLELQDLKELSFEVDLFGFDFVELSEISESVLDENKYTQKTDVFTYEPTGEKPNIKELFDDAKTQELLNLIDKTKLSDDEKSFLFLAAQRHTVFNFEKIANYYAHSNSATQKNFEDSALVIIDFDDAISGGFVALTKTIKEMIENER